MCVIILMVSGSIGAGVAIAGTFSLVRFRSVPGTAREILAVFLSMAAGLACGMGCVAVAAVFTLLICLSMRCSPARASVRRKTAISTGR